MSITKNSRGDAVYGSPLRGPSSRVSVPVVGTAVPLGTLDSLSGFYIKALATNTRPIHLGDSTVTVTNGYPLAPGEELFVPVKSLRQVFIDAETPGEGVAILPV